MVKVVRSYEQRESLYRAYGIVQKVGVGVSVVGAAIGMVLAGYSDFENEFGVVARSDKFYLTFSLIALLVLGCGIMLTLLGSKGKMINRRWLERYGCR